MFDLGRGNNLVSGNTRSNLEKETVSIQSGHGMSNNDHEPAHHLEDVDKRTGCVHRDQSGRSVHISDLTFMMKTAIHTAMVKLQKIDTELQVADWLTKFLPKEQFVKLCTKKILFSTV